MLDLHIDVRAIIKKESLKKAKNAERKRILTR